jgi:hypothetical protein
MGDAVGSGSAATTHVTLAYENIGSGPAAATQAAGARVQYDDIQSGRAGSKTDGATAVATGVSSGHSLDHPQSNLITPEQHTRQIREAMQRRLAEIDGKAENDLTPAEIRQRTDLGTRLRQMRTAELVDIALDNVLQQSTKPDQSNPERKRRLDEALGYYQSIRSHSPGARPSQPAETLSLPAESLPAESLPADDAAVTPRKTHKHDANAKATAPAHQTMAKRGSGVTHAPGAKPASSGNDIFKARK